MFPVERERERERERETYFSIFSRLRFSLVSLFRVIDFYTQFHPPYNSFVSPGGRAGCGVPEVPVCGIGTVSGAADRRPVLLYALDL